MFYTWIDGTDVKYTAWNYYEPNNVGEEDCGELYIPLVSLYIPLGIVYNLTLTDLLLDFLGHDSWWIGLSDQAQEMFYTWIDGTDVKYTAWIYYEPNNVGEEDCGELYIPLVSLYQIGNYRALFVLDRGRIFVVSLRVNKH